MRKKERSNKKAKNAFTLRELTRRFADGHQMNLLYM